MIRFNVILSVVIVAVGLLIAGAVSGSLVLVDSAIGVAALALVLLVVIVMVSRQEIFGEAAAGVAAAEATGVAAGAAAQRNAVPVPEHELPVGFGADGQLASTSAGRGVQSSQSAGTVQFAAVPELDEQDKAGSASSGADSRASIASRAPRGGTRPDENDAADRPAAADDGESRRRETGPAASKPKVGGSAAARSGVKEAPSGGKQLPGASRDSAVAEPAAAEVAPATPAAAGPDSSGPVPAAPAAAESAKAAASASPDAGAADAVAAAGAAAGATASNAPKKAGSPSVSDAEPSAAAAGTGLQVTVVPGIGRYHLPGCILIRFLGPEDLQEMTMAAAESSGCVPCKACRPDSPGK